MKRFAATTPELPDRPETPAAHTVFFETTETVTAEKVPLELVSAAAHQYRAAEIHWNGGIRRWGLND